MKFMKITSHKWYHFDEITKGNLYKVVAAYRQYRVNDRKIFGKNLHCLCHNFSTSLHKFMKLVFRKLPCFDEIIIHSIYTRVTIYTQKVFDKNLGNVILFGIQIQFLLLEKRVWPIRSLYFCELFAVWYKQQAKAFFYVHEHSKINDSVNLCFWYINLKISQLE